MIIINIKNDLYGRFGVAVRRQTFDVDVRDADRVVAVGVFDGSAGAGAATASAAGVGRRTAAAAAAGCRGQSLAEARLFAQHFGQRLAVTCVQTLPESVNHSYLWKLSEKKNEHLYI